MMIPVQVSERTPAGVLMGYRYRTGECQREGNRQKGWFVRRSAWIRSKSTVFIASDL